MVAHGLIKEPKKQKTPLPRSGEEGLVWGPNETQGLSMRLNSSSSEGRANHFAVIDAVPQLAATAEGCRGAKER